MAGLSTGMEAELEAFGSFEASYSASLRLWMQPTDSMHSREGVSISSIPYLNYTTAVCHVIT
ncbi:hypothetical protein FIU86_00765 [Roseovarius sp. THAF9]|nr:hypothetical protein FIU86_00765 [Roseovarius sp. THAF9]